MIQMINSKILSKFASYYYLIISPKECLLSFTPRYLRFRVTVMLMLRLLCNNGTLTNDN